MYFTQEQIDTMALPLRKKHVKIEVLNANFQTEYTMQGVAVGGSISKNANDVIRRSGSMQIAVPHILEADTFIEAVQGYEVNVNGKIWLDKNVKIYIGVENYQQKYGVEPSIVWYDFGVCLIDQPVRSFTADSFQISFNLTDLMVKLTGERQGQITGISTVIPIKTQRGYGGEYSQTAGNIPLSAESANKYYKITSQFTTDENYYEGSGIVVSANTYIGVGLYGGTYKYDLFGEYEYTQTRDAIISVLEDIANVKRYSIYNIPSKYQFLPYEIKVGTGATVYDILKSFMEILSAWQICFDNDGVLVVEPIPSGKNDITYPLNQDFNTSDTESYDFGNVKNQIVIYGKTHSANFTCYDEEDVEPYQFSFSGTAQLSYETFLGNAMIGATLGVPELASGTYRFEYVGQTPESLSWWQLMYSTSRYDSNELMSIFGFRPIIPQGQQLTEGDIITLVFTQPKAFSGWRDIQSPEGKIRLEYGSLVPESWQLNTTLFSFKTPSSSNNVFATSRAIDIPKITIIGGENIFNFEKTSTATLEFYTYVDYAMSTATVRQNPLTTGYYTLTYNGSAWSYTDSQSQTRTYQKSQLATEFGFDYAVTSGSLSVGDTITLVFTQPTYLKDLELRDAITKDKITQFRFRDDTFYILRIGECSFIKDSDGNEIIDLTQKIIFELYSTQQVSACSVDANPDSPFYINRGILGNNYYCDNVRYRCALAYTSTGKSTVYADVYSMSIGASSQSLSVGDVLTFMVPVVNKSNNVFVEIEVGNIQKTFSVTNIIAHELGNDYQIYQIKILTLPSGGNDGTCRIDLATLEVYPLILSDGEYDNIYSDLLAKERADYELFLHSNLQNTITLSCIPDYSLDVNYKISYDKSKAYPKSIKVSETVTPTPFMVKSISYPLGVDNSAQSITAIEIYDDFNYVGSEYATDQIKRWKFNNVLNFGSLTTLATPIIFNNVIANTNTKGVRFANITISNNSLSYSTSTQGGTTYTVYQNGAWQNVIPKSGGYDNGQIIEFQEKIDESSEFYQWLVANATPY